MTTKEERSKISQAIAKAIAYKDCGQQAKCEEWARVLVELLQCKQILKP